MQWLRRFRVGRVSGQSFAVMAVMMVVLIAIIGLSVDVGNAYGRQRRIQSAANAGSLAGMLAMQANKTNGGILQDIQKAMMTHGIDLRTNSTYKWEARYYRTGVAGYTQISSLNSADFPPSDAFKVEVWAQETVDTYFSKIIGRKTLPATAQGAACLGPYPGGVYPLAVPFYFEATPSGNKQAAWYDVNDWVFPEDYSGFARGIYYRDTTNNYLGKYADGSLVQATDTDATYASANSVRKNSANGNNHVNWNGKLTWESHPIWVMPVDNKVTGVAGQHIGWFVMGGGSMGASDLAALLMYPGKYRNGPCSALGCYSEATPPSSSQMPSDGFSIPSSGRQTLLQPYKTIYPNEQTDKKLSTYDWVDADTGVSLNNNIQAALDNHIIRTDIMTLPMYGASVGNGSNAINQLIGIGKFRFLAREYQGNNSSMTMQYLGQATRTSASCSR